MKPPPDIRPRVFPAPTGTLLQLQLKHCTVDPGANGYLSSAPAHHRWIWWNPKWPSDWWFQPQKYYSVGVTIPNIWKNKSHVPNHQPAISSVSGGNQYKWEYGPPRIREDIEKHIETRRSHSPATIPMICWFAICSTFPRVWTHPMPINPWKDNFQIQRIIFLDNPNPILGVSGWFWGGHQPIILQIMSNHFKIIHIFINLQKPISRN